MNKFLVTATAVSLFASIADARVKDLNELADPFPNKAQTAVSKTGVVNYSELDGKNILAYQKSFDTAPNTEQVMTFTHDPSYTPKIPLRVGMSTTFVFDQSETIQQIIVGNNRAFKVSRLKDSSGDIVSNKFIARPAKAAGVDTNITVIMENGRIYNYYVRSYTYTDKTIPALVVYNELPGAKVFEHSTFMKAEKADIKPKDANASLPETLKAIPEISPEDFKKIDSKEDYLKTIGPSSRVNGAYKILYASDGDLNISPRGVFDDGTFTYFDYRHVPHGFKLPTVHKVVGGYDQLVNLRFQNGFLIAESISQEGWTLVSDPHTVCIKPEVDLRDLHNPMKGKKMQEKSLNK